MTDTDDGPLLTPLPPEAQRSWLARNWAIPVVVVAALIGAVIAVKAHNHQTQLAGHAVTYTVTASAAAQPFDCSGASCAPTTDAVASTISYLTAGGAQQANGQALPWTYSAQLRALRSGAVLVLSAQRSSGDAGSITCAIQVDGATVATNTSNGQYAVVTCSAPF